MKAKQMIRMQKINTYLLQNENYHNCVNLELYHRSKKPPYFDQTIIASDNP